MKHTFRKGTLEFRIGFNYGQRPANCSPRVTQARLYARPTARPTDPSAHTIAWTREPWVGEAKLHPLDEGRFCYEEGRRIAVRRLIQNSPRDLRPLIAGAFFGKSESTDAQTRRSWHTGLLTTLLT